MSLSRAISLLGYVLFAIAGLPASIDGSLSMNGRSAVWLAAYATLGVAFHVGASAPEISLRRRRLALRVMLAAMLTTAAVSPCRFGSLMVVIVASQAALALSPLRAGLLIVATTSAIFLCTRHGCRTEEEHLAWMIALLGFQSFAAVAVFVGRRELEGRLALASANAELRATRSLLAEASRANERARIARELHDVLGHDLTALGLQLEIATHVSGAEAATHVAKAQEVSARLLRNVRAVVSATSSAAGLDLASALRELSRDLPGLAVHLDAPAHLAVDDAARAHCMLRCAQEVITNALRHARAHNVWITLAQADDAITMEARDDGCGAEEVCAGNGLSGMRARLEELGGRLRVTSAARRQFVVSAWLPARGAAS